MTLEKIEAENVEIQDTPALAEEYFQRIVCSSWAICILGADPFDVTAESAWAKYIPGGYSPSRCLKLSGKPMVASILALAGTCLLFFGYDAAVMSLVNINPDYLQHMNSANGTENDAARVGGIVSFWFLGFLIGMIPTLY